MATEPKEDGIQQIQVNFPIKVKTPLGFERALEALVDMICTAHEQENPDRVMWVAGMGGKPNMRAIFGGPKEGEEMFDMNILSLDVVERAAGINELRRHGFEFYVAERTILSYKNSQFLTSSRTHRLEWAIISQPLSYDRKSKSFDGSIDKEIVLESGRHWIVAIKDYIAVACYKFTDKGWEEIYHD